MLDVVPAREMTTRQRNLISYVVIRCPPAREDLSHPTEMEFRQAAPFESMSKREVHQWLIR